MKRKRKKTTKQIYRRSFLLSFSLSLLALCSIGVFIIRSGKNIFLGNAEPVQGLADVPYPASESSPGVSPAKESDCLTVLFMGVKDEESASNTYLLARFDPINERIPIVSLPPQTMVIKPEGDQTPSPLWETYRYGGRSLAVKSLSHTLGIPIDRYVVVDLKGFQQAAQWIGSVQYSLRYALNYQDAERTIRLTQGLQLVDGQKAIDIITYPNYAGGETTRSEITAELAVKIVNDKLELAASPSVDNLFKRIINYIDTDITYKDFETRKASAAYLANRREGSALQLPLDGGWPNAREYHLSQRFLEQIQTYFGTVQP
jgi:LCP family protein required for cell wall assembly